MWLHGLHTICVDITHRLSVVPQHCKIIWIDLYKSLKNSFITIWYLSVFDRFWCAILYFLLLSFDCLIILSWIHFIASYLYEINNYQWLKTSTCVFPHCGITIPHFKGFFFKMTRKDLRHYSKQNVSFQVLNWNTTIKYILTKKYTREFSMYNVEYVVPCLYYYTILHVFMRFLHMIKLLK